MSRYAWFIDRGQVRPVRVLDVALRPWTGKGDALLMELGGLRFTFPDSSGMWQYTARLSDMSPLELLAAEELFAENYSRRVRNRLLAWCPVIASGALLFPLARINLPAALGAALTVCLAVWLVYSHWGFTEE